MHDRPRHVGLWIEDPVPPENPEAMAFVRQHSPVPVLTGENLYGFHGFERLIELQGATACTSISRNGRAARIEAHLRFRCFLRYLDRRAQPRESCRNYRLSACSLGEAQFQAS